MVIKRKITIGIGCAVLIVLGIVLFQVLQWTEKEPTEGVAQTYPDIEKAVSRAIIDRESA